MTEMPPFDALQAGFSGKRVNLFTHYARSQTSASAWALMNWDAQVGAALSIELGHVEVLVRNAIHRELVALSNRLAKDANWFDHLGTLGISGNDAARIEDLKRDLQQRSTRNPRRVIGSSDIVAGLSFGLWRNLVGNTYHRALWDPRLHRAFSNVARPTVSDALGRATDLRNRIAHRRPICKRIAPADTRQASPDSNVAWLLDELANIRRLAVWVAPAVASFLAVADLEDLIRSRP